MVSTYKITKDMTLREYLTIRHLSSKESYKLVETKAITNDISYLKLDDTLKSNTLIYIDYSAYEGDNSTTSYDHRIKIIYEDSEIIIIDKDENILIHPDSESQENAKTILNAVYHYLRDKSDDSYVRPLHRIDFETRGLVVFAKNILAYSDISYQITNKMVTKYYEGVVEGIIEKNGAIDIKIGRNRHDSHKYLVSKTGKDAHTEYEVLERKNNKTKLKILITTGRTHQIRVSMAYIKHPIVGDKLYGKKGDKLMLISKSISFMLDKQMTFYSKQTLSL